MMHRDEFDLMVANLPASVLDAMPVPTLDEWTEAFRALEAKDRILASGCGPVGVMYARLSLPRCLPPAGTHE